MKSQWESLLLNLGEWQGSFTRFSPNGELVKNLNSVVSLQGLNNNQTIHQVVSCEGEKDLVLEYSSLGRGVLFFPNGAFSQGTIQLAPFSESGSELGLIHQNRRLRLIQVFDKNGELDNLTLIREHLAGTDKVESTNVTVQSLVGEWQGEALTIYPDLRSPDIYSTKMQLQINAAGGLDVNFIFPDYTKTSTATIKDSVILFGQQSSNQVQVLLLPDGASATCPRKMQLRQPFFMEVGWLIEPNLRQRMIRTYNDKGEWISLTLVTEHRQ